MKNKEKSLKFNNTLLTGADGGTAFSAVSAITLGVSLVFSFIIIALGEGGSAFLSTAAGKYLSYFLSSLGLAVSAAYITVKGKFNVFSACGFRRFELKYLWLGLALAFGALFGLSWLNGAFIDLLGHFGYTASVIEIPKRGFGDFILCTLIVCVLPAFFEELAFRGFILAGSKRLGETFAVIAGGALFSLFHKNPAQTPYQFVMGALFCLIAIKSGSVFPSMIMHFINNFYIIVVYFALPSDFVMPSFIEIPLGVLALLALIASAFYLIKKCNQPEVELKTTQKYLQIFNERSERKQFLLFSLAGVALCACMWLLSLFPQ